MFANSFLDSKSMQNMNAILDNHISAFKNDSDDNTDKSLRSMLKKMQTPFNPSSRQELMTYSTIPAKEDPS